MRLPSAFGAWVFNPANLKYDDAGNIIDDGTDNQSMSFEDQVHRTFDFIILSDVINDVWDVQMLLNRAREHAHAGTRIIINFHSHLWSAPLRTAQPAMKGLSA